MRRRVVIATIGSLGDLHPFMAIAQELQTRGYAPAIATLACYQRHVEEGGIPFHAVRLDIQMDNAAFMRSLAKSRDGLDSLVATRVLPSLQDSFEDLRAYTRGAIAMIVGSLSYAAPPAADDCGVPWCSAVLSPLYVAATGHAPPVTLTTRHRSAPRVVLALFSKLLAPREQWSSRTAVTGFAFYRGRHATEAPPALDRFLNSGSPPLVFTLGSAAIFAPDGFIHESVHAAQLLRRRAVVLTGPNTPPERLPPEILAIPYAPFSILFPRAAALIHHGGIGTVGEALRSGRPMLIVPRFLDQPDNAIRVRRVGVARIMHATAYRAKEVAMELHHLLANPRYSERAREVGATVRCDNGTVTACDIFEREIGLAPVREVARASAATYSRQTAARHEPRSR